MSYKDISRIVGLYLFGFSLMFLVPLTMAIYYQFFADSTEHLQPHTTIAFLLSMLTCILVGLAFYSFGKKAKGRLFKKEAILVVATIWLITPAIAATPFLFSGTLSDPVQAYFESVSGLSTTGSTILEPKAYDSEGNEIPITRTVRGASDTTYTFYGTVAPVRDPATNKIIHEGIEAVSKAILLWRSFLNWLGGLGIIVLFVAILPSLGMSGKFLFQTEVAGPWKDPHAPRIGQAALQLWGIYAAMTLVLYLLLLFVDSDIKWFDALTTSLSTVSGGGFSIHNIGMGFYNNPAVDWIVILFMVLCSTNFAVYFLALRGKFYRIYQPELILFFLLLIAGSVIASLFLIGTEKVLLTGETAGTFNATEAFRYGTFQMVSSQTSVGLANIDYDRWPYAIQILMVVAMFIGGMSGSTASGAKIIRIYLLYYVIRNKLRSLFRADAVRSIKIGNQEIDINSVNTALCYLLIVVIVAVVSLFIYVANGMDPGTSLGLVTGMINNTGLTFRAAGPTGSCAFMSDFSLGLSSLLMIMGRLEFFVILALIMPTFWKDES